MNTRTDAAQPLTEDEIAREAAAVIRRHLGPEYRIFLFGSRAAGSARKGSDYDIGVEGPGPVPFALTCDIKEEFERLPTLATVEIVDFSNVSESFRDVARMKVRELAA